MEIVSKYIGLAASFIGKNIGHDSVEALLSIGWTERSLSNQSRLFQKHFVLKDKIYRVVIRMDEQGFDEYALPFYQFPKYTPITVSESVEMRKSDGDIVLTDAVAYHVKKIGGVDIAVANGIFPQELIDMVYSNIKPHLNYI